MADDAEHITLKVIYYGLQVIGVHFRVKLSTRMEKLKKSYVEFMKLPPTLMRFTYPYGARTIEDDETAEVLKMKENDVVKVFPMQFKCKMCEMAFSFSGLVMEHLMIVHGVRDLVSITPDMYEYLLPPVPKFLKTSTEFSNAFIIPPTCSSGVSVNKRLETEDSRNIDELVDFIEGDRNTHELVDKKKKRKKQRMKSKRSSPLQPNDADYIEGNTSNFAVNANDDSYEKVENSTIIQEGNNDSVTKKLQIKHDVKHSKLESLQNAKREFENRLAENLEYFATHEQNVENFIGAKSVEIKDLILNIEKYKDEKDNKLKEVSKVNIELSNLMSKITDLNAKKTDLLQETDHVDEIILKYKFEQHKLEDLIDTEFVKRKQEGCSITKQINELKTKLQETEQSIRNLSSDELTIEEATPVQPNQQLLDFIKDQISEKEKELECPVCLEVATAPIFMCREQHLICSTCTPRVRECPECRVSYKGQPSRHRYAEKISEELQRLRIRKQHLLVK